MKGKEKPTDFFFFGGGLFVLVGVIAKFVFGHIETSNTRWLSGYMCIYVYLFGPLAFLAVYDTDYVTLVTGGSSFSATTCVDGAENGRLE